MNRLNDEITNLMQENGADLVGFGDLKGVAGAELPFGIVVAVAIPLEVVKSIHDGPNMEYYEEYHRINALLNKLVLLGSEHLIGKGYRAYAQTTEAVKELGDYRTALPHKTVATRAGLGWIGKCALLVTKEYGSAIRISSFVTDAALQCAQPIDSSSCGGCTVCEINCPGGAVSGALWDIHKERNVLLDAAKCRETARRLSFHRLQKEITLCGKCMEACPYTQHYIAR